MSRLAVGEMPDAEGQHFEAAPLVKLPSQKAPKREGPKDASTDNVLVPMQSKGVAGLRVEVMQKAHALRPAQLVARIEYERRADLPGAAAESHVRKSRSHPAPGMDQHDRDLRKWERDYEKSLRAALKALEVCRAIEVKVLVPVRHPSRAERLLAIGEVSPTAVECETCHGDVEAEMVRGGPRGVVECEACDRRRRRQNGQP